MEKRKVNMSTNDLKELFDMYDSFTLDSIKHIFEYAKDYNMEDSIKELNRISNKKYIEEVKNGDFEGCNELYFFSILDININNLNETELAYFKNTFENALIYIPKTIKYKELIKEVIDITNDINQRINSIKPDDSSLSTKELEEFFNKFNANELEEMTIIYSYVKDYDVSDAIRIKQDVYNTKISNSEVSKSINTSLLKLANKTKKLTDREFNYFYDMVSDAAFFLSSIRDFDDYYSYINEDFDEAEFPIDIMNELEDLLTIEKNERNNKPKLVLNIKSKNKSTI